MSTTERATVGEALRILVVDDCPGDVQLAAIALERAPGPVDLRVAEDLGHALAFLEDVDLVLLDLGLPDSSGLDGLHLIRSVAPQLPVIILTGEDDVPLAEAALHAGAQDYLCKDEIDARTLLRSVRHARTRQDLFGRLEASERWGRALIHSVSDVVTIHRADGQIVHVGGRGAAVIGAAAGLTVSELRARVDRPAWRRIVRTFRAWCRGEHVPLEFAVDLGDRGRRHLECAATNLLSDPMIGGVVVTTRDVTDRYEIQHRLAHEATHDSLTGLVNRARLNERLEDALEAGRGRTEAVALLLVDLDHFKRVNDSFGHAAGDVVLRTVAERLGRAVREQDILGRLGGDEFVALCPGVDSTGAALIAGRLQRALDRPFRVEGRDVHISSSIGIAVGGPGSTAVSVLRQADLALYESKRIGRARTSVFAEALEARAVRRMDVETALRRALVAGGLQLRYQPIVDLATGAVVGHEALVRWHDPVLGEVQPAELVQIAEESGLIVPVGRWVLEQGCRALASWRRDLPGADFHLAVNASARELADPAFAGELLDALDRAELPHRSLCLELTESALIEDEDVTGATLRRLRAAGVRIALDDFGTGYSSLTYLKRLPVDVLKVDRTFTEGIADHADDRALVASLVGMARALGLEVVAEGVEDQPQRDELRRLGCGLAQGFLWSEPVDAERAAELLRETFDVGDPSEGGGGKSDPASSPRPGVGDADATIALVAHELMQPLTVIKSYAESFDLLRATEDPAAITATIGRNAATAIELVFALRDAGELERGTLRLEPTTRFLADVLGEVVEDLRRSVAAPIELVIDGDAQVELDASRFRQIITNLVTNAAAFAPPGTDVVVRASADDVPTVSVVDSGPGVPADREHELFRRFSKLGRHRGTGLGLYLSRQLARLHGGDLTHRRAATGGAEFVLALPAAGALPLRPAVPSTDQEGPDQRSERPADAEALVALQRATRALLGAAHPEQVVGIATRLVRDLGGGVVPATFDDIAAIPVDLALGEGPPLLPTAAPLSVARLRIERLLPSFVEDARDVVQRLRLLELDASCTDPDTGLPVGPDVVADSDLPLRSAVVVATGDDARQVARLVRSVADPTDVVVRWSPDALAILCGDAGERPERLRQDLVDEGVRWGIDALVTRAVAADHVADAVAALSSGGTGSDA